MRCTELLARLLFALLLVTSGNAVPDDVGTGESVAYLKTLLIRSLDDEEAFSRHAIHYLALTGQESIPFVDNLAGNYPLVWLNLIQQFQQFLPDCPEALSLLDSILNFFIRESSFVVHWERQWKDWQQKLEEQPDKFLLHWLVREWLRLVPGGGHWKAEQFWQSWLTGQTITPEMEQLGQLHYPAPCRNTPKPDEGTFGLPGASAHLLHDRGGGPDVVIRPGGSTPYHPNRQKLEHAARFHHFAASHPSRRSNAHTARNQVQENSLQKSFDDQQAQIQQRLNNQPLSAENWQAMISLLKSGLPKASNPEEVEQSIRHHENQLVRVKTHHGIMARFNTEPLQARKDHIAFLENEGGYLFSEARQQHDIEAAQWEIRSLETFEAMSQNRQQMTMVEYRHWLEHNMAEFTGLRHHPQLTAPIQWEQQGVQLSGRVCHRKAGCFKKTWLSGITALSEADNPGALQNQNALMVLLDGIADLEKLRRQTLADIQAQQQQTPDENLLFTALETLGRGEDPLTQGIEQATESMVRVSYQHFPEGTERVLHALSRVDSAMDAVVEFIDDSTGNRVSAVWQQLDEITQARILGAGKVLSVLVPVAKVRALAELARVPSPALKKDGWHPDSVEARHKEWQEFYSPDRRIPGASEFEASLFRMSSGERVAHIKVTLKVVAQNYGWVKDNKISKMNDRDVYKGNDGFLYSIDSQHGRFEKNDPKSGKHIDEVDIDLNPVEKKYDSSGQHDLKVK
ncbi:hypothetical protein [Endozoicomonas sp. 4G]|uniref:hypothetical protein n=1 Tax=Endozoicomonas sp. 4G TaxID=2872754 RepID=UPI002078A710|nr:hypothetical protein [Endozoicomonas sp. 4G]